MNRALQGNPCSHYRVMDQQQLDQKMLGLRDHGATDALGALVKRGFPEAAADASFRVGLTFQGKSGLVKRLGTVHRDAAKTAYHAAGGVCAG